MEYITEGRHVLEEDLESLAGVVVATHNEARHVGEHIYDRMRRVEVDACAEVWPEPSVCGQRHTVDALGSQGLERERQGRNAIVGRRSRLAQQHRSRRATVEQALHHGAEITRQAEVQEARVSVPARLPLVQRLRFGVSALSSAPSVVLSLHALLRSCYGRIRQLPIAGVRF
jgi:hypothetical protein